MTEEQTLAETVVRDGEILYAPVVACRPKDPRDYCPNYLRVWNEVAAKMGREPIIYSGSVEDSCESCKITVMVGPRQQEAMAAAHDFGLATHVTCLVCATLLTGEADEVTIATLGNPEDR